MKFMELDIQKFASFRYNVVFNANTGTGTMETQMGHSEDEILKANTFTKEGYVFAGWNTSADGTGISISEGMTLGAIQALTQNDGTTLYAQWQEEETPDKYMTLKGLQRYDTKIKEYMVKDCPRVHFITENSSSNPFIFEDHELGIYIFYKLEDNYSHPAIYFKATSSNTDFEYWTMTPAAYMVYFKKPSQASTGQAIAKIFSSAIASNNTSYTEETFSVISRPTYSSGIARSSGDNYYLDFYQCVQISGDQTISGKKTFNTLPEASATVATDNQLTNKKYVDGNFLSKANTTSYTPTSDYSPATKKYVDDAVGAVVGMSYEVVSSLPATGENGKIYLISNSGSGQNIYDEYIWISGNPTGSFEKIGTADINLNNYYTKTEADAEFTTSAEVNTLITNAITSENLVTDANYVHTDNNYTAAEKTKLAGVEAGAEVNVIETIKVNGTALVPDANKAVDITINTANPTNADIDGLFA